MTPNVIILHIRTPGRRGCQLWLPVFLLWIPGLLLAPFVLLALLVYCLACGVGFWRALVTLWTLLCALPGTDVLVDAPDAHVLVRIY
ncbi:MAG: hypothetical protein WCE75_10655 [Terracidiphilus sp.]